MLPRVRTNFRRVRTNKRQKRDFSETIWYNRLRTFYRRFHNMTKVMVETYEDISATDE